MTLRQNVEMNRKQCAEIAEGLFSEPSFFFDNSLRARLPLEQGIYLITQNDGAQDECVHAGQSVKAERGLLGRIWDQHYCGGDAKRGSSDLVQKVMGRRQLSRQDAKLWISNHCRVQWLVIRDQDLRCWAEHYMLSVLRPTWGR